MKASKKHIFSHILNVVTIAMIVECFLCSFLAVRLYAREDCFERMEETADQMAYALSASLEDDQQKLISFAGFLASNTENPDEILKIYMESFCDTQYFSAICIHRANGSKVYYGEHPHGEFKLPDFATEAKRLPYISKVYSMGRSSDQKLIYQAVPIVRKGQTVGILYGYMPLSVLPHYVRSAAYDGDCQFYIAEGKTGDYLMHDSGEELGNLQQLSSKTIREGYDLQTMKNDIRDGKSGYFVYRSEMDQEWLYTYYRPMDINDWSLQMTIRESTAFASYYEISKVVFILAVLVIVMMFIHVSVLMLQTASAKKKDKILIRKSQYMYEVQRELLGAQNNEDCIEHALKTVGEELQAETAMLLSFSDKTVKKAHYWPSKDKRQAMDMIGRNIRDDFPMFFDCLIENESVIYSGEDSFELSETSKILFQNFDIRNIMLSPIMDHAGVLKGVICVVNTAKKQKNCDMIECVAYDFYMAIANTESHAIIKRMSEMDYLTGIKNRNSYESKIVSFISMECKSLWCIFVDVNGLHEVNNSKGHKEGDRMLCAVANALKRSFGTEYTYRLGGDEFVAFAFDIKEEDVLKKKRIITAELAAKKYYVSIGYSGAFRSEADIFDIETIIAEAESFMYREKWEYYEKNNISTERIHKDPQEK